MNFPIQKSANYINPLESSGGYSVGKSSRLEQDNIYAQYKPALSKDNSISREYPPTNLQLVIEPKKMEFDILMK